MAAQLAAYSRFYWWPIRVLVLLMNGCLAPNNYFFAQV